MQFGPEWMRPKIQNSPNPNGTGTGTGMTRSASTHEPSPTDSPGPGSTMNNGATTTNASTNNHNTTGITTGTSSSSGPGPGATTYSALLTPAPPPTTQGPRDASRPFRYSRDEMLRIFREGGGKGPLGLEVERWEGVVRDVPQDPVTAKPMTEGDKKVGDISYIFILIFILYSTFQVQDLCSMLYWSTQRVVIADPGRKYSCSQGRSTLRSVVGRARISTPPRTLLLLVASGPSSITLLLG
jgi:hypothetical protein